MASGEGGCVTLAISQSTQPTGLIPRSSGLAVSADRAHGVRYGAKFGGNAGREEVRVHTLSY